MCGLPLMYNTSTTDSKKYLHNEYLQWVDIPVSHLIEALPPQLTSNHQSPASVLILNLIVISVVSHTETPSMRFLHNSNHSAFACDELPTVIRQGQKMTIA